MKKYQNFSDKDFAGDASFIKWVKNPDTETAFFWETFIKTYPEKRGEIRNARQMILSLNFREDRLEASDIEALRKSVFEGIRQEEARKSPQNQEKKENRRVAQVVNLFFQHGTAIAAGIAFMAVGVFAYFLMLNPESVQHKTEYGMIKTILLPDSSLITLNANSTLSYNNNWNSTAPREVWLNGEAYFSVTHQQNNQKFVVHTQSLNVEVLGTEFNVANRKGNAQVVLNIGKVKIGGPEGSDITKVTMQPGELVELSKGDKVLRKKIVNPEVYSSWRNRLLTFDDHTMREVINIIENNFGIQIELADPAMLDERITGTLPSNDIEVVLAGLSKTFGMIVSRDGNKVLIRKQE